jgi:predicted RNA-binding Zn-ribbon protein involved in translation (DUF1610 family)
MPTLKDDRTLMDRHFRDLLYLGLPFVFTILLTGGISMWYQSPALIITGFVASATLAIVGISRQIRRFRHFPCPACGTVLHRSDKGKDGSPVTFLCKGCDTEWDTGFRSSHGD